MLRSGMIAFRLGRKTTLRSTCPLHSIVLQRIFSSKDCEKDDEKGGITKDAGKLAKDAGRIAQESSKQLARAFSDLSSSNEVKIIRLTAAKACKVGKKFIAQHIVKNPQVQLMLVMLKKKLADIPTTATEAKSQLTEKVKEIKAKTSEKPAPKKEEADQPKKEAKSKESEKSEKSEKSASKKEEKGQGDSKPEDKQKKKTKSETETKPK